ncbi:MAG: hypothetical protein Q8S73_15970 [Deltaproteobacteria bacterium]|nr:hypothetical protein [Myxococcales bacterium]MDP3215604.1 hypothetical protein [Deltaproteobacteria bacterium]
MSFRSERLAPEALEEALLGLLKDSHRPAARGAGVDLLGRDGRTAIEVKATLSGVRDLQAALVQLALAVRANPSAEFVVLIATIKRLSRPRALQEFEQVREMLRPEVGHRLALIAATDDGPIAAPDVATVRELFDRVKPLLTGGPILTARGVTAAWTNKTVEVWKVLFDGWLQNRGPMTSDAIVRASESSSPTVLSVLTLLNGYGEIERGSDRRVMFNALPQRSLGEVLVVLRTMTRRTSYVDGTGRAPDPHRLLRKVQAGVRAGVSLGGIVAARHYQPDFDLNGLPRLDVCVCARPAAYWEQWTARVGPALRESRPGDPLALLVVHHLPRTELRRDLERDPSSEPALPFAEPSEVILHLYDAGLHAQAESLTTALRSRATPKGERS